MNNNLLVPNQQAWPLVPLDPSLAHARGQRRYSATNILDFATLMRVLFHWRWLLLGAVAAGLALALLKTMLATPQYRASVTLEANPPTVAVSEEQSRERDASVNSFDFVATQVGLLGSKAVAQRTAQELNLTNNPELVAQDTPASERLATATGIVSGGLKVIPPEEGQLIVFTYDSPSPQFAATIANGIADSFINTALQRRYEASAYARNFLQRQINKTRGDLERSERQLVAYAQKEGIISTISTADGKQSGSDTGSLQGESLIALNQALAAATARRVGAEGAYRGAQSTGPTADVTTSTSALRQQRAQLLAQYQEKRQFMKSEHPEMQSLQAQIDELGRQIARESSSMTSGHNNTLLADYKAALSAERALQARVGELKGSVLNLRGRSIQYNILQREVDTNRSLYDALLQRFKEIGVAGGVGMAPVSVVDRADPPLLPFKPNLILNLLVGLGLGLLAGAAGAVGLEFVHDTIKNRDDVRNKLGLACLGIVPKTAARENFVQGLSIPTSIVSEAYSAIAAALRYSTEDGMPKVLAVTSTRSGEGKSSSALAIAQNLARRDSRVLLIDADLRKPAFKVANDEVGLSKLLTTDDRVIDHVLDTQHERLKLLPAGPIPPNPADLLSSGRIRRIIAEAGESFDHVVIDGPPTLGLADSPLLAAAAGNILFVIESGSTRTRAAIESINRLDVTGSHLLGAVLTKASENVGGYGYDHYGYAYGKGNNRLHRTEILMIPKDSPRNSSPNATADAPADSTTDSR